MKSGVGCEICASRERKESELYKKLNLDIEGIAAQIEKKNRSNKVEQAKFIQELEFLDLENRSLKKNITKLDKRNYELNVVIEQ